MNKLKKLIIDANYKNLFLLLFAVRIPYLILFYPGLFQSTTGASIKQFFGIPTLAASLSSVPGLTISNHHPVIYAYVWGSLIKLGGVIGSQNFGYFLCVLIQVLLANVSISYLLVKTRQRIKDSLFIIVVIIFCLFPLISIYQICLSKDVIFSSVLILFCTMIYEIFFIFDKKDISFMVRFIIVCIFLCLTKSQGVYILILTGIILLFIYKRKFIKGAIITFLISFIYLGVFCPIILPALNVAPVGKQESIGFMLEQTARYVISNAKDLTQEEIDTIDKIIPYDKIVENYNPVKQDSIKFLYRQNCSKEDLLNYYKVWFSMFFKHPETYIKATILNCKDFFTGVDETDWFQKYVNLPSEFNIYNTFQSCKLFGDCLIAFSTLPFINLFFNTPIYIWLTIMFFIIYIIKKDVQMFTFMLPLIISVLILVVSPVASFRYILMLVFAAPVFSTVLFSDCILIRNKKIVSK